MKKPLPKVEEMYLTQGSDQVMLELIMRAVKDVPYASVAGVVKGLHVRVHFIDELPFGSLRNVHEFISNVLPYESVVEITVRKKS